MPSEIDDKETNAQPYSDDDSDLYSDYDSDHYSDDDSEENLFENPEEIPELAEKQKNSAILKLKEEAQQAASAFVPSTKETYTFYEKNTFFFQDKNSAIATYQNAIIKLTSTYQINLAALLKELDISDELHKHLSPHQEAIAEISYAPEETPIPHTPPPWRNNHFHLNLECAMWGLSATTLLIAGAGATCLLLDFIPHSLQTLTLWAAITAFAACVITVGVALTINSMRFKWGLYKKLFKLNSKLGLPPVLLMPEEIDPETQKPEGP